MSDSDWIAGREVSKLLAEAVEPDLRAHFLTGLELGKIEAKAGHILYLSDGNPARLNEVTLPPAAWSPHPSIAPGRGPHLSDNCETLFEITNFDAPVESDKLSGCSIVLECESVQYRRSDVGKFFGTDLTPAPVAQGSGAAASKVTRRGGRSPDSEKWDAMVAATLGYVLENGIDRDATAAKLHAAIASYAMERGREVQHEWNLSSALNLGLRWARGFDDPDHA